MTYRLSGRLLNKGLMGAVAALLLLMSLLAPARAELVQFVYTSDQHYGITRKAFRGLDKVSSREVNAAMVQAINTLPGISTAFRSRTVRGRRLKCWPFPATTT